MCLPVRNGVHGFHRCRPLRIFWRKPVWMKRFWQGLKGSCPCRENGQMWCWLPGAVCWCWSSNSGGRRNRQTVKDRIWCGPGLGRQTGCVASCCPDSGVCAGAGGMEPGSPDAGAGGDRGCVAAQHVPTQWPGTSGATGKRRAASVFPGKQRDAENLAADHAVRTAGTGSALADFPVASASRSPCCRTHCGTAESGQSVCRVHSSGFSPGFWKQQSAAAGGSMLCRAALAQERQWWPCSC